MPATADPTSPRRGATASARTSIRTRASPAASIRVRTSIRPRAGLAARSGIRPRAGPAARAVLGARAALGASIRLRVGPRARAIPRAALWPPGAPTGGLSQDPQQALSERPPPPAERHWDGGQDTDWYPIQPQRAAERLPAEQRAPERLPAEHRRKPDRGSRGLVAGAFTGVLSAAIALGVAMLVSAFIRPQASPIIAVGGQAINLTPTPLKEFAVAHFGTNDKTMLLGGMYVTIALLAMVIGWLARRKLIMGVIGLGAFGVLGAFVALIQPASRTTDAIPALVGGVAGVAAIIWLGTQGGAATATPPVRPAAAGGGAARVGAAPRAGGSAAPPATGWMEDDPAQSPAGVPGG